MRALILTTAYVVLVTTGARAQPVEHPASLTLEGGSTVAMAARAERADLLGLVELYSVAIYADRPMSDRAHLLSTDTPKALRVAVTYKEDLRRGVTLDWQRELVPRFQPAATSHLRSTFLGLRHGDVVLVEYVPQRGTTIRVNRSEIVTGASHDVILTFLDHWIGQRPVSNELKRSLLGSS